MKRKNKIVAIQGDPINTLNQKTDTTLLLALEAQRRGYRMYYYETKSLTFENGKVYSFCNEVIFYENRKKYFISSRFKLIKSENQIEKIQNAHDIAKISAIISIIFFL